MYVHMYVCMHACICMYVCIYIYIYIYIYGFESQDNVVSIAMRLQAELSRA